MARRVVLGRHFSPYSPAEDTNAFQECLCSLFLPGSREDIPQDLASAYLTGEVRLHDSSALTLGETDGISASHFCSFEPSSCPTIQLNYIQTYDGTLLVCLDNQGNLHGMQLGNVIQSKRLGDASIQPSCSFSLLSSSTPSKITCFTVDDTNKRIFAGDNDGTWWCYDLERADVGESLVRPQAFPAHQRCIVDGDYCQGLLTSSSEDGAVCVWDIRSQSCVAAFDPASGRHLSLSHTNRAVESGRDHSLRVRFDKNGRHVVASSRRKHITVWNVRSDSAQCTIQTDCVPCTVDTAKDFIFFSGGVSSVWRYSMYNAQMQCYDTFTANINHLLIDRDLQKTMVISGAADTVELLSLDGASLGKVTGRKDTPEQEFILSPAVQEMTFPSLFTDLEERHLDMSPHDSCESGTEMVTDEEGDYEDEGSSVYDYSPVNDDAISFSTGEEVASEDGDQEMLDEPLESGTIRMDMEPWEVYGFTSDSDITPRYEYVVPIVAENVNCDVSTSQSDEILSDEEEDE